MKGLYIHIPFCKSICSYCDFTKMVSSVYQEKYIKKLIEEISLNESKLNDIDTIFIGGGTPNSIDLNLLELLLNKLSPYLNKSTENSIELNPELINEDLVILLKKYKINRISIGVETFNDESLKLLNRNHKKIDVINAINLLKKYEFNNINIDLIFAIPNTNLLDIKNDLDEFIKLNINHISYYDLILEEKTVFYHLYKNNKLNLVDEDMESKMYDFINDYLKNHGYIHYEISNYAKCGFESLHNLKYWNIDEYIAFGLGASSYLKYDDKSYIRYKNTISMTEYLNNSFIKEKDIISLDERKKEYLMLGLRKVNGVSINRYKELFNSDIFNDFNFQKLIKKDLIEIDNDYIRIKKDKLFLSNLVFMEFVGD